MCLSLKIIFSITAETEPPVMHSEKARTVRSHQNPVESFNNENNIEPNDGFRGRNDEDDVRNGGCTFPVDVSQNIYTHI